MIEQEEVLSKDMHRQYYLYLLSSVLLSAITAADKTKTIPLSALHAVLGLRCVDLRAFEI